MLTENKSKTLVAPRWFNLSVKNSKLCIERLDKVNTYKNMYELSLGQIQCINCSTDSEQPVSVFHVNFKLKTRDISGQYSLWFGFSEAETKDLLGLVREHMPNIPVTKPLSLGR